MIFEGEAPNRASPFFIFTNLHVQEVPNRAFASGRALGRSETGPYRLIYAVGFPSLTRFIPCLLTLSIFPRP